MVTAASVDCFAVEISVGSLHKRSHWSGTIGTTRLRAETIECCDLPGRCHLKNRALIMRTSLFRGSVKIPVAGLEKRVWACTVSATPLRAKTVECGDLTSRSHFENRSTAGGI